MADDPLNVIFPVARLKADASLLNPENTESVWEYYLLENLSCGLVRDSRKSALGYEGCLADKFYKEDPQTWIFYLRRLKWSDGSEVTESEIKDWLSNLCSTPHRHIRFLPQVKKFSFDPKTRKLTLIFSHPMDHSILHELSLADSGLFPQNFKMNGWHKTVGPYFVRTWDSAKGVLELGSNRLSPLYRDDIPETVILKNMKTLEEKERLFTEIKADIVPTTAFADPILLKTYKRHSGQEFNAHPSSILFWYFNYENTSTHDVNVRLRVAKILEKFRGEVSLIFPEELQILPETQMIPDGFNGRLESLNSLPPLGSVGLNIEKVKIRIPTPLKIFPQLGTKLLEAFKKDGIQLEISFDDSPNLLPEEFARIYLFVGNQLDSSGSWSFLMGPPLGPLSPWLVELKNEFNALFSSNGWADRLSASKALHQKLLADAYAIPLFIGNHRYFLSERVNALRWNVFDSRLRFYELSYQ